MLPSRARTLFQKESYSSCFVFVDAIEVPEDYLHLMLLVKRFNAAMHKPALVFIMVSRKI